MRTLLKEFDLLGINTISKSIIILGIVSLIFSSCKNPSEPSPDPYAYLPLEPGYYTIYNVRQEVYSADKEEPIISSWQQKSRIESSNKTGDNVSEVIVGTYKRDSVNDYWRKIGESSIKRFPDRILTTSDNRTLLSLVFPINTDVQWNGNMYNNQQEEKYQYANVNEADSVSGQLFKNTLTVIERMDSSVINKYIGVKKYALEVGLIFDEQISFEYCQTDECLQSNSRKVESGYRIIRMLEGHGRDN